MYLFNFFNDSSNKDHFKEYFTEIFSKSRQKLHFHDKKGLKFLDQIFETVTNLDKKLETFFQLKFFFFPKHF